MYKSIDADLIDRGDEDQVAVDLEREYSKFGFEFEPDGVGDAVRVTKNKGTKEEVTEVFDLDPAWYNLFTSEEGEAKRMKEWLEDNTSQEDVKTFLRDKQNRFDVDAPDPSKLQVNEAAKTEMFDEPKEEVEDFREKQLKELDFDSIKVSPAQSYMGVTQEDITAEIDKGFKEVLKRKDESLMAMKSAIGMEEGKVIANLTGNLDGAIVPGQEEIVADQTRKIISEKKKASSEKRYEKGDDNYWANIALNYQELTSPNKYNRTLDEIENNDSFFERTTSGTRTKSSELVREGLNIAYTSYADERDKLMESMNENLKDAASLEIKIKEAEDKFISGGTFNGSQEDYDKYVADFTKLVNIYNADEFKTLNNLQKNIDATLADYEVNPDVTITEANEVIRKRYQERLDNVYKDSNFLFLTGMNISQMATAGVVRGLNAIASTANNLVPDNKYDFGDIIEDSLDEFAEVIELNLGGSSKLKRAHFERYANVYGFDVVLDPKGNPTGQVYGSDGYLVKSAKADEILTAYSADPSIFESESKINVGADIYQTLPTMVDMVMTLLPIAGVVGRGARLLGASQKVSSGIGTAAGVFIQSHDDFYDAAIEAGASESEAALFGSVQSLGVAVVSMLNPLEAKAVAATMSKASVQNLAKQYVKNIVAGKTRRDAFKLAVEATTKQSLKAKGKELVKGAVFEGLEETVGEISADQIISNTWKILGGADVTSEVDFGEAINTFFMAGFASLPFSIISLSAGKGTYRRQMLYGAMNNTDIVRSELEKNKGKAVTDANGVVRRIDDDYINEYVQQLEDLKSATKLYFENTSINEEDAEVIVDLVARRKALTDEMKNTALDGVSRKAYQEAISKIDDKLSLYINKESNKPFYVLEGEAISKEELDEKMSDEEWVAGLKSGRWSLSVYNDSDTESNVRKLARAALKTEDASDELELETQVREAKQEVTDYIGQKISKLKMEQKVDPVLEKVSNSEEINENEVDGAIEALFEEIDNVRESDLSDDAKESIITELYKQAQTLENYELTTETKVISTTQRRPIKRPPEVKEENTKTPQERIKGRKVVRVEGDDFAATVEAVEDTQKGKTTKPTRAEGEEVTVIEEAEDGSLLIQNYDSDGNKTTSQPLSANSMNDFELVETTKDENGIVTGAILRNKNNDAEAFFIEDADLAMDLAIQKTQAEVGFEIEEEVFEEAIEEVEVLKGKKDDKKTTEQERLDSEKQRRKEDSGQVQEPEVSEEEGATDTVLQEEQQVERETEESIKQKIEDLNVKTSKEKNRAIKREALRRVAKAMTSLKKKFPDVKFVVHTTQESFAKTDKDLQEKYRKSGDLVDNGYFDSDTNTIHINLSTFNGNLDLRTIGHEVFHAVLYNSIGIDTGRVDFSAETKKMLSAVERSGNLSKDSMDSLKNLIGKMDLEDFEVNEEFLAEMVGMLSMEQENLSLSARKAVMKWINDVAKKLRISSEIFKGVNSDAELIEMLNTLSKKIGKGEVIGDVDVAGFDKINAEAISNGGSTFITEPTTLNDKKFRSIKLKKTKGPFALSLVKESDLIDFRSLIDDIVSKDQNVWFWNADQLGLGIYQDVVVGTEHFLEAGPSYALDPKNRDKGVIWATGKEKSEMDKNILKSDYIFIMSGSPQKSKMFNKGVITILKDRVGDYTKFKKEILESKPIKPVKDVIENHNSWESLTESPDRKKLLLAIEDVKAKQDTPLKRFLESKNAFIDMNSLRDGFFLENDFQMNDIMLVLKPESFGGKSSHSTYENDILGEVVGVPDIRVNAYDIMPDDVRDKHNKVLSESAKAQVVAPYGIGIKKIKSLPKQEKTKKFRSIKETESDFIKKRKQKEKATDKLDGKVFRVNKPTGEKKSYPLDNQDTWWGDSNYKEVGGVIEYVSPDEFLSSSKKLNVDEYTLENVEDLKQHVKDGRKLDPLVLYDLDLNDVSASDGRHRALMAKDLGISTVPVINFTGTPIAKEKPTKAKEEKGRKFRSIKDYVPNDRQTEKLNEYIFVNGKPGLDSPFGFPSSPVRTVWANWFLGEDVSAKSRIAFEIDQDIELQAALKSSLYDLWKEKTGSDISYEKFLDSEITLYRGVTDRNVERGTIEENGFNTYTLDKERRGRGGQIQVKKKVKDLYGATQIVGGEIEVLEPTQYSEEFSQRLYNERSDQYARLPDSDIRRIIDTADKKGFYEAYKLGEELISKRKKTKKFRSIKREDDIYTSNIKDGLFKLKPQPLPSDVWIKKIAEAGGKGTAQELESIGLKDYLDSWMKDNKRKSVPKDVVEQYVYYNEKADVVDFTMSKPAEEPQELKDLKRKVRDLQNRLSNFWESEESSFLRPSEILPNSRVTEDLRKKVVEKYRNIKDNLRKAEDAVSEYLKKEGFQAVQDREDLRKYKSYTMPGGTNYREVLITLPGITDTFKSNHWSIENIVAHIRMTDRILNGKRVLFIDEIQSDWAQEGRRDGFKDEELREKAEQYEKDNQEYFELRNKLYSLQEVFQGSKEYSENIGVIRDSGIYNWTGVEGLGADLFGDGKNVTFTRSEDVPTKETEIPFDQLPESYKNAFNTLNNSKIAKEIREVEKRQKELESKYGVVFHSSGRYSRLREIENYENAFGETPDMPYKKTQQWAGLALRRIFNIAANEGYDRVAFTRGEQIWRLVGGVTSAKKGIIEFYDNILRRLVRDEARRLDKKADVEIVEFGPLAKKEFKSKYAAPDTPALGKQVSIEITPKMSEGAKRGVKKFRSVAKENTKNRKKGQSTLVSKSEETFSNDSIVPIFKRGKSITTTLYEDKPISVLPIPERFLRNSPTFNRTVDTDSFMYKLGQEFDYVPGGVYVDVTDFKNKTSINSYVATSGQISIDPNTGRESLSVSENQPSNVSTYDDIKKTQNGSVVMTNLIKKGGGKWTWWSKGMEEKFENVKKLVSVNTKGQHIYSLSFESTTPIMLKNNVSGSEPRLRPTTKGEIFLGEVVGVIRTGSGKEHAVYDRVYTVDPKDTQTLDRLNYKYRKKPYDYYSDRVYTKLGQKPPVTLASRQTDAHQFLFDKLGIKNAEYVGGGVEASVYDIGKGRIIRISGSGSDVLNKLVNKKIEGVTPVYATGVMELPTRTFGLDDRGHVVKKLDFSETSEKSERYRNKPYPIYYSIMQKGDPSDSSVADKLRPILSKLRIYIDKNGIKRSGFGVDIESLITKDLSNEQLQDFINNKEPGLELTNSEKKDLERIILINNNLRKELGLKSRDSHLGNYVRNSKGELEAIDLGSFGTFEEGFEPQPSAEKNKLKFRRIPGGQSNTNLKAAQDLIREESKVSRIRSVKSAVKKFIKGFGDFQFPVKRMLEKAGLEIVSSRLQNIKGAGAFAKLKFDKVRDEIFGKMTVNERYDFDRYITARRAVAANEARNQRIDDLLLQFQTQIKDPLSLLLWAKKNLALGTITQKEYDAIMEREQGGEPILTLGMTPEEMESDILTLENDYPKFKERADKYFDVFSKMLEEDLDNGLITQEQYDAMEGINYSPRVFLKYVFNIDGEIDGDPNWKNKLKTDYGMSEENIKKLTVGIKDIGGKNEGFIMDLMMDSEVILANYMNARARKNAMNRTTARLAKDFEGVKQRFDDLKDKKKNLASVGKELSNEEVVELESLQKIMDSFSDSKKKLRGITSELIYYVDGERKVMYTTPEIKDMWFDNKDIGIAPNMDKWAGKTGTNVLKAMATGINPLFAITNAPRDFVQVLAFTDTYSKTRGASFMPVRMAYLLKDFLKSAYDITMKNQNFEDAVKDGLMMEFLYKEGRGKDKTFKTTGEKAIDILMAGRKDYLAKKSGKLFGKLLYLNEVSEIGFRMAIRDRIMKERVRELDAKMESIYGSSFDKDNMTDEQQEMYDQNMEDIRDFATAKARAYMDFSTGGSVIKGLDPALPYLNAAAVGAFASSKYIAENKVKFSVDALQLTAMGTGLTAGGSVALMAMFRDDDDEDKDLNNWQLFMREYNRIPPYITDRYHVVFTGRRDDRGGYEYVKIAKNQGLAPFYSIAEGIIFNTFNTQFMKSDGYLNGKKIYSDEDMFFNASRNLFNNYNPFGFDPLELIKAKEGKKLKAATVMMSKVLTRNPAIGGVIELGTNYDLFRGKPITYSRGADYLKPKYQGYRDDNLEKFWIDISRTVGMASGAEMKFAFEKILTSPSTNPFIATLYGFAESKSITTEFLSTKQKGGFEQVISQMSKRAMGYTNPNYNPVSAQNKKKLKKL